MRHRRASDFGPGSLVVRAVPQVTGFVYAIRSGDSSHVKIGYSRSPSHRLATLQTGSPVQLVLVASARAPRFVEERLHQIFDEPDRRLVGEWFDFGGIADALIREIFALVDLMATASCPAEQWLVVDLANELASAAITVRLDSPRQSNAPDRTSRQMRAAEGVNRKGV